MRVRSPSAVPRMRPARGWQGFSILHHMHLRPCGPKPTLKPSMLDSPSGPGVLLEGLDFQTYKQATGQDILSVAAPDSSSSLNHELPHLASRSLLVGTFSELGAKPLQTLEACNASPKKAMENSSFISEA